MSASYFERGALLDQLELQLADLEENAAHAETAAQLAAAEKITVPSFERRKAARRPHSSSAGMAGALPVVPSLVEAPPRAKRHLL